MKLNYIIILITLGIQLSQHASAQKSQTEISVERSIKKAQIKGQVRQKAIFQKTENGITCEEILITDLRGRVIGNSMVFGQKIKVYFKQMKGFVKKSSYVYPEFTIAYIDEAGDTVSSFDAMKGQYYYYNKETGIKDFGANLSLGTPVFSNKTYTLRGYVADKNGPGKFEFDIKVNVLPNPWVKIQPQGITCKEVVLMYNDDGKNVLLTGNKLSSYNDNYINIIGYDSADGTIKEEDLEITLEMLDDLTGEVVGDLLEKVVFDETKTRKHILLEIDSYKVANSSGNICRAIIRNKLNGNKLTVYIEF